LNVVVRRSLIEGNKRKFLGWKERFVIGDIFMCRYLRTSLAAPLAIGLFGFVALAWADEAEPEQAEIAAIRAAAKSYLEAKRQHNAEEMRKSCTVDGDYVDADGRVYKMHDLISKLGNTTPRNDVAPAEVAPPQTSLRFITSDVAIEDSTADSETMSDGRVPFSRFTAVWVKRNGRWLLDSLRESSTASATTNSRLLPLAWLLGEWSAKAGDSATLVSARWSDGGHYIVRDFVVRRPNSEAITASQRIGWDPRVQGIKSWSFDSQGGFGEALWVQDGPKWIVESKDVTADGKTSRSATAYTPSGTDRYVWEVRSATIGSDEAASKRVEFKRAPADE
jgi:hypothetical protein